jgi:hypothetical protein
LTEDWSTSNIAYITDDTIGYLIGYFQTLYEAHRAKDEIQNKFGVKVVGDIRLVGLVPRKKDEKPNLNCLISNARAIFQKANDLSELTHHPNADKIAKLSYELAEHYETLRKQREQGK